MTATVANSEVSARQHVESIFATDSTCNPVATVHGYGIQLKIQHGHLVITDGIGIHRRERRYPQADRTLRRIIITGPDGYLTLDALQYCRDHGITVTMAGPDGELVGHYATADRPADARLQRRQVAAAESTTGLEITRELLRRKVTGQGDNLLKLFNDMSMSARLYRRAEQMFESDAITQTKHHTSSLSELEGWAARDYFASWPRTLTVPFDVRSLPKIPSNWRYYPGRSSVIAGSGKKYNAADPINAMLNYGYALGYSECRTACIAHGLNPLLGFVHADRRDRDSLALDVLEAIRPAIDAYILSLIGVGSEPRKFTYRDFTEPYGYEPGTVRLVAPLTHEIAEASYQWETLAMDAVQTVVSILTGHAGRRASMMPNWELEKTAFMAQTVTVNDVLTDRQWKLIQPLLPVRERKRGHPPIDDRVIIAAMIHCERHGRPWAHVPGSFRISYRTLTERRRYWQRTGHWPEIKQAIDDVAIDTARTRPIADGT